VEATTYLSTLEANEQQQKKTKLPQRKQDVQIIIF
jgi:hypothetical protein